MRVLTAVSAPKSYTLVTTKSTKIGHEAEDLKAGERERERERERATHRDSMMMS
jgi:hypothetical protein